MSESFDLLVVGGGINGVGIARDAAGRGLGVLLVEQGDLAGATSSASSNLIHGGLRYLEHAAFRLVRSLLSTRPRQNRTFPRPVHGEVHYKFGLWLSTLSNFTYLSSLSFSSSRTCR